MASRGAEYEGQIQAWIDAYERLPEERRELLKLWFATQRLIVENAGISLEAWCAHLEWAIHHPLDYSFVLDFPAKQGAAKARDASQRGDETSKARTLIGAEAPKRPLSGTKGSGVGLQAPTEAERPVDHELLTRFMRERMKPGAK